MKYRCLQCEDPCVLEIAMKADFTPSWCPWGFVLGDNNAKWEEWPEEEQPRVCDCPNGSLCEFFDIETETCLYGKI